MPTVSISKDHHKELQDIADSICRANSILVVTGAGISTNSGIPDFRSANGLYNMVKARYPNHASLVKGRDLFDSILFQDPTSTRIFYTFLAEFKQKKDKIPTSTPTHKFIKTLSETGQLLRCYTQNIDGLEKLDGMCMDLHRGLGRRGKGREKIGREVGCEVVRLHGDLEMLRCTLCGILTDYTSERMEILLGGESPECPDCESKAEDREKKGKRSIGVGGLRPNIVLYDEPHPHAELIGRLTHHDATRSAPDCLLIFGTSLKVLGLKRLVKAFAARIHEKGGQVIYINDMPAAESTWGSVLDWHIQMDCDAWVKDLKFRRKEIWEIQSRIDWKNTKPNQPPCTLKSRKSMGNLGREESDKENPSIPKLKRSKSTGNIPKKKQLPTPISSPSKAKFSVIIPIRSPNKRVHEDAFPDASSPLSELSHIPTSPACFSTPSKRRRLPLGEKKYISTPQPPSPGCFSNLTTPSRGTPVRHPVAAFSFFAGTPQQPSPSAFSRITTFSPRSVETFDPDETEDDDDFHSAIDVHDETVNSSPTKEPFIPHSPLTPRRRDRRSANSSYQNSPSLGRSRMSHELVIPASVSPEPGTESPDTEWQDVQEQLPTPPPSQTSPVKATVPGTPAKIQLPLETLWTTITKSPLKFLKEPSLSKRTPKKNKQPARVKEEESVTIADSEDEKVVRPVNTPCARAPRQSLPATASMSATTSPRKTRRLAMLRELDRAVGNRTRSKSSRASLPALSYERQ